MEDEKCKLYNEIYKAIKKCYSDQSSDAWTKKSVNLWNKVKEDSCRDLNKLKADVGIITKKINSEHCRTKAGLFKYFASVGKMTDSNKQPIELNAPVGKNDDIIATSISEVLPPLQSQSKSILFKSAPEDSPLSTAGSSATPKPAPAQDKLTADIDTLTKKIEWHKSALVSGIDENVKETRKKIKFLIDERKSALKRKHIVSKMKPIKRKKRGTRRNRSCKNLWREDWKSQPSCLVLLRPNELDGLHTQIMKVCFILLKK